MAVATLALGPGQVAAQPDAPPPDGTATEPGVEPAVDPGAGNAPGDEGATAGKKRKRSKAKVSGFLTSQFEFRIEQNDDQTKDPSGFRIGKAVVRVKGRLAEHVGYTIEVDPRSPTIAGVLRDGYISIHWIPGHVIRIGQQKVPFGYENWLPSVQLYIHHRSELSEGLGRGFTHRDIGIGLVGKLALTDCLRLEDAVAVVNGAGFGVQSDDTSRKNLWGRIGLRYKHPGLGIVVHAGVSGAFGDQLEPDDPGPPPVPAFRFAFKRLGGDLELDHRWVFLGAEYGTSWDEVPAGSGSTERSTSYFVMAAGKTPWHVGPVVRYENADAEGFTRFTIGAYWGEPKARFRVITDYEYFEDDLGVHDGRVTTQASIVF